MDAWMNILPVLEQGVDILKINSEEIFLLTEKNNMEEALGNCLKRFRVGVVAVTAGPGKAYLATEEVIYTYKLPKIEEILNPIGAGDTVSSVMFSEYVSGACPHEAFASGLAAASASCLTNIGGLFSREKAAQIKKEIEIETKKL
jgi:fructose-1-phosphate kinase PfkB-like protein